MNKTETIIAAFSEEHAERLTGISQKQLRYWDQTGFFVPEFASENRRVAFGRIYSFRDIVALRVLNVLRNQYSVPLQHLRRVSEELASLSEQKWTATELFVLNKRVIFVEPDTQQYREIVGGQYVIGLPLRTVVADTMTAVRKLSERDSADYGAVERRRNVSRNAVVAAGTRIPVATIVEFLDAGYGTDAILAEFPSLNRRDVEAAIGSHEDRSAA